MTINPVAGALGTRPSIERVISGGQSGVDRAALNVALDLGLPCGGWVPKGRRAEDGPLAERYPMRETASRAYVERTRRNVRDADATLILTRGEPTGGTALTVAIARRLDRPCLIVDLNTANGPNDVKSWLNGTGAKVLNVAGPRESSYPGIYDQAVGFLVAVFTTADDRGRAAIACPASTASQP